MFSRRPRLGFLACPLLCLMLGTVFLPAASLAEPIEARAEVLWKTVALGGSLAPMDSDDLATWLGDGTLPQAIRFHLYGRVPGGNWQRVTVPGANGATMDCWDVFISLPYGNVSVSEIDLPGQNASGEALEYCFIEAAVTFDRSGNLAAAAWDDLSWNAGLTEGHLTIGGHTLLRATANLFGRETQISSSVNVLPVTGVSAQVIWDDQNNRSGKRPEQVMLHLFADGEEAEQAALRPDPNGTWTYLFDTLPRFREKRAVAYAVEQDALSEYATQITADDDGGFVIVNTLLPEASALPQTGDQSNLPLCCALLALSVCALAALALHNARSRL